ncbi:hypothetical protein ABT329_38990, partial [Streptomyces minutiscleroticus]
MADEQDKWLNREAAERLLRGEPLECADAAVRARADRLAGTLRALAAGTPPTGPELPGEAAAVAAFRQARTGAAEGRYEVLTCSVDGLPVRTNADFSVTVEHG